jgi:hypothetical protein
LDSTVSVVTTIVAVVSALSAIVLGWLKWGREDAGQTASTAKTLVETMRDVSAEVKAQRDECMVDREALRVKAQNLEAELDRREAERG